MKSNLHFDESGRVSSDILLNLGACIDGVIQGFAYKTFFEGALSMIFPTDFAILPEFLAKLKYPSQNRPPIIYTSYDTKSTFTFNLSTVSLRAEQTKEASEQFRQLLKKKYPLNEFSLVQEEQLKDSWLSWFTYRGHAIDDRTFDIMYVTPVMGYCMIGTFSCLASQEKQWNEIVVTMLRSIEIKNQ